MTPASIRAELAVGPRSWLETWCGLEDANGTLVAPKVIVDLVITADLGTCLVGTQPYPPTCCQTVGRRQAPQLVDPQEHNAQSTDCAQ